MGYTFSLTLFIGTLHGNICQISLKTTFALRICLLSQPAITCSKLTIEILEQQYKDITTSVVLGVSIVNFEYILYLVLVFLLLTLCK